MTTHVVSGGRTIDDRPSADDRPSPAWIIVPFIAMVALIVLMAIAIATSSASGTPTEEHPSGPPDATPAAYVTAGGG